MSPIRATLGRTVGRTQSLLSTALTVACFLLVAALSFSFGLEGAEGEKLSLCVIWAASVAPLLPALAAFLGMDVWSEERQTGRIDLLLTASVRERDLTFGKFLGVYLMTVSVLVLFMAGSFGLLGWMSPDALKTVNLTSLLLAFAALALQSALWSAVAVAASALSRHAATAASVTLVLLVGLPRGLWEGLKAWAPEGRVFFGEMPLDAHVVDIASGLVPVGTVAAYCVVTALVLFIAAKAVASCRLIGRGARLLRLTTTVAMGLSLVLMVLVAVLARRLNPVVDLAVTGPSLAFSQRTRNILAETEGVVTITAFQSRQDSQARFVSLLLRALQRKAEAVGGARISLRFVDPRWDVGAAERLVGRGIAENTLVFESGRRCTSVPIAEGVNERVLASALRHISSVVRRRKIYWTVGHGETGFDDHGVYGMSDIVRDLHREGFGSAALDLAGSSQIPGDCAVIVIAGARDELSRVELGRLNAYLHEGGRLLVLLGSAKTGGVASMLPAWGIRPVDAPIPQAKTLSGTDVIVTEFPNHPVSAALKGSRIILERPVSFLPSSVAESGAAGVDRIGYSAVASVGASVVVASVERGMGAGDDLAVRPTRIVAIGDQGFVQNGQLAARAGANRDFFLNAVAYLSGADAFGSGEPEAGVFVLAMDRDRRRQFVNLLGLALPGALFLIQLVVIVRKRRAS